MTVRDLITVSLLKLGIIAQGEIPDASMAAGGLRCLNSLLDSWAIEDLLVYVVDRQTFALATNTQTYTLGPGGVWNTTPLYGAGSPRPVEIQDAWWQDANLLEQPITVIRDHQDYQRLRAVPSASPIVTEIWYDATAPLGTVWVNPTPSAASTIVLYLWHPWNAVQTLDTVLTLAPGYQRLLEYNLPIELSSEYPGTLRPELVALATESKERVERRNVRVPRMTSDLAGVAAGAGGGRRSLWAATDWLAGRD